MPAPTALFIICLYASRNWGSDTANININKIIIRTAAAATTTTMVIPTVLLLWGGGGRVCVCVASIGAGVTYTPCGAQRVTRNATTRMSCENAAQVNKLFRSRNYILNRMRATVRPTCPAVSVHCGQQQQQQPQWDKLMHKYNGKKINK